MHATRPKTGPLKRGLPKPAIAIAAILMLAACASGNPGRAEAARQSLVRLSRADLLTRAGGPDKTGTADSSDYLGYASRSPRPLGSGVSIGPAGFSGNLGGGIGRPLSRPETEFCKASFTLRDNREERVDDRPSREGGPSLDQCSHAATNCADAG